MIRGEEKRIVLDHIKQNNAHMVMALEVVALRDDVINLALSAFLDKVKRHLVHVVARLGEDWELEFDEAREDHISMDWWIGLVRRAWREKSGPLYFVITQPDLRGPRTFRYGISRDLDAKAPDNGAISAAFQEANFGSGMTEQWWPWSIRVPGALSQPHPEMLIQLVENGDIVAATLAAELEQFARTSRKAIDAEVDAFRSGKRA